MNALSSLCGDWKSFLKRISTKVAVKRCPERSIISKAGMEITKPVSNSVEQHFATGGKLIRLIVWWLHHSGVQHHGHRFHGQVPDMIVRKETALIRQPNNVT
jgi:hypothetical protein